MTFSTYKGLQSGICLPPTATANASHTAPEGVPCNPLIRPDQLHLSPTTTGAACPPQDPVGKCHGYSDNPILALPVLVSPLLCMSVNPPLLLLAFPEVLMQHFSRIRHPHTQTLHLPSLVFVWTFSLDWDCLSVVQDILSSSRKDSTRCSYQAK